MICLCFVPSVCLLCSILVCLFVSLFSKEREKESVGVTWEEIWEEKREAMTRIHCMNKKIIFNCKKRVQDFH